MERTVAARPRGPVEALGARDDGGVTSGIATTGLGAGAGAPRRGAASRETARSADQAGNARARGASGAERGPAVVASGRAGGRGRIGVGAPLTPGARLGLRQGVMRSTEAPDGARGAFPWASALLAAGVGGG